MDADGNFVDPGTIAEIEQAAQRLVDASTLPREEILALARRIVRDAGIEDVHLAAQE
jgi:hypothetical protein